MAELSIKKELEKCMKFPRCIRNVCILAHVDHGKTTIADCLLATNGVVSKRLAGTLRFLDDRLDEQQRQITMKSSAVSLLNAIHDDDTNTDQILLLNMIDTPGHIDFSSEVTAAVRICDGAIILVDVVEGVCAQTRESIKQAFEQKAKMILILNKLDRLFVNQEVNEIYLTISQIVESCNSVVAQLYQYTENETDIEETGLLFEPAKGNVIFASAIHGWGFTLKQIAPMFLNLLPEESVDSLTKKLWDFDNYISASSKSIKKGASKNGKTNVFTQLCLKTLKYIYDTIFVRMDKEKVDIIAKKLNIQKVTRDMTHNDVNMRIKSILESWKPIADTILQQCYKVIPAPCNIPSEKIENFLNQHYFNEDRYLNECVQELLPCLKNCSSGNDTPVVLYVSKMFCVDNALLSQNQPKQFTPRSAEELREFRKNYLNKEECTKSEKSMSLIEQDDLNGDNNEDNKQERDITMVALARIFAGNLSRGQEIYVLHQGYTPNKKEIEENLSEFIENNKCITKTAVKDLYMVIGRELLLVDNIPAGNICAIGGLESAIVRTATASSTVKCIPFIEQQPLEPIVRNVIEPLDPTELPILRQGLKDLMQSDSCVQVQTQETGELVLLTCGSVHLEKCLEDLTKKFAKIEINVSSPLVSLRETIIHESKPNSFEFDESTTVTLTSGPFTVSVIAVAIPECISKVIERNYDLLKIIEEHSAKNEDEPSSCDESIFKSENMILAIAKLKENLRKAFGSEENFWQNLYEKIWSVGPMKDSINLLINGITDYQCDIFTKTMIKEVRNSYNFVITNTFKYTSKHGPLCEERLMNCAFIVRKFDYNENFSDDSKDTNRLNIAGIQLQLNSLFRDALLKRTVRLMEPIFTTEIQVNTSILGKVYTVLGRRHGKVVDAVGMDAEEKKYIVKAELPVIESIGFADEIRKITSGHAMPNLRFSHYEIINGDPFYQPAADDEDDDEVDVESAVRANKLRMELRSRKGLYVVNQVVTHAEKQRTLNKKK